MKKLDEKNKIAMKIANHYAESYKILEIENATLKKELDQALNNVSLNKILISDIVGKNGLHSDNLIHESLKRENNSLKNTVSLYKNENDELKRMFNTNHLNIEPFIIKYQKTIESLQNKVFTLENSLNKKEHIIKSLNNKLDEALYCKVINNNTLIQEIGVSIFIFIYHLRFVTLIKQLY